jgi:thiamine biosynthesis protein ThiS
MNQLNQFVLNGQKYATSTDLTISDVINYFGYNKALLVVEYNHFICSQTQWNTISIQDNDEIEIVTIVGGG